MMRDQQANACCVMRWPCSQSECVVWQLVIEDGRVPRLLQRHDIDGGGGAPSEDVGQLAEEPEAQVEGCDAKLVHCDAMVSDDRASGVAKSRVQGSGDGGRA